MRKTRHEFDRISYPLILSILGWSLCGYLVFRSSQIHKMDVASTTDLCHLLFAKSCDPALNSSLTTHLGYPLAGWGFTYFGFLSLLLSFNQKVFKVIALGLSSIGMGIAAILIYLLFKIGLSCPLCYVIHLLNLMMILSISWSIRSSRVITSPTGNISGSLLKILAPMGFLVILGGVVEYVYLKTAFGPKPINLQEVSKKFQTQPIHTFPKSFIPPQGSESAPVQLVVFSSFQCPSCKVFASVLVDFKKKFGDELCISFKNFPLSESCNPRLLGDMQPQACQAALAAIAANQQNKFWAYHDKLFDSELKDDERTLSQIATSIDLDMTSWNRDRSSEATLDQLKEDINLGNSLGLNATPTVFINGRKAENIQEAALLFLIQHELDVAPKSNSK